jgi:hypothetical protein
VSGRCPAGSIVTVYDNDAIRGSARCVEVNKHGEYSIPIRLFAGKNVLRAKAVNELGVGDLESNVVTVYYDLPSGCGNGQYFLLPVEGVVNAAPGVNVLRHVVIVGGTQPYQLTWDWGDGDVSTSVAPAQGQTQLSHVYKTVGIYTVLVKAVDNNGAIATTQIITSVLNSNSTDLLGHHRGRLYERRLEVDERRWLRRHMDRRNRGGRGGHGGGMVGGGAGGSGALTQPTDPRADNVNHSAEAPQPSHIIHPDGSFQL